MLGGPATFRNLHEVWDGGERRQDDPGGVSGYVLAETDGYDGKTVVVMRWGGAGDWTVLPGKIGEYVLDRVQAHQYRRASAAAAEIGEADPD